MPELSGTIRFEVAGGLSLEAVHKEIGRIRDRERMPQGAVLTRLTCKIEGEVTKCSVKWEVKASPYAASLARPEPGDSV